MIVEDKRKMFEENLQLKLKDVCLIKSYKMKGFENILRFNKMRK